MAPPLALDDNGDLLLFDSAEEASRSLEAVDVRNGVYRGFDGAGQPLLFATNSSGAVEVAADGRPCRIEELSALLAAGLARIGINPKGMGLPALLERARQEFRIS
jgi:hypothetical protein